MRIRISSVGNSPIRFSALAALLYAAIIMACLPTPCGAGDSALVRNNLFSPERRPGTQHKASSSARHPGTDLTLCGTSFDGSEWKALIQTNDAKSGLWVMEGETVEGVVIKAIDKYSVQVVSNGGHATLTIEKEK